MTVGIYAIYNVLTDKMYIGSAVSVARRWRVHRHMLNNKKHHSPKLQTAYDKYGHDAFEWQIVEYVADKDQLIEREQFWIDFFKPIYNSSPTAYSCLGFKHTEISKERMRRAQIGRKQSAETIATRSAKLKGHVVTKETRAKISRSHLGITPNSETRAKMSAAKKGLKQSPEIVAKRVASIKAARLLRQENRV